MQKLGIFHHQSVQVFPQGERGPAYYQITDMETLTKFPNGLHSDGKEWPRSSARGNHGKTTNTSWNSRIGQVLRDAKPSGPQQVNTVDPVIRAAYHLQDLRYHEKKAKGKTSSFSYPKLKFEYLNVLNIVVVVFFFFQTMIMNRGLQMSR